jgi:hypothetical protein
MILLSEFVYGRAYTVIETQGVWNSTESDGYYCVLGPGNHLYVSSPGPLGKLLNHMFGYYTWNSNPT